MTAKFNQLFNSIVSESRTTKFPTKEEVEKWSKDDWMDAIDKLSPKRMKAIMKDQEFEEDGDIYDFVVDTDMPSEEMWEIIFGNYKGLNENYESGESFSTPTTSDGNPVALGDEDENENEEVYEGEPGLKTFEELRKEFDHSGNNHCLKLVYAKCNVTSTCRCSAPKKEVKGICYKCQSNK